MDDIIIKKVCHSNINEVDLKKILKLKQQHWPYSIELQKKWIDENVQNDDIHQFIKYKEKIVAYMNIVRLIVKIDGVDYTFYGMGNLCVDKNHLNKGWARLILKLFNCEIKENNMKSILLCKDSLVNFYEKCGWKKVDNNIKKSIMKDEIFYNIMFINCDILFKKDITIYRNF